MFSFSVDFRPTAFFVVKLFFPEKVQKLLGMWPPGVNPLFFVNITHAILSKAHIFFTGNLGHIRNLFFFFEKIRGGTVWLFLIFLSPNFLSGNFRYLKVESDLNFFVQISFFENYKVGKQDLRPQNKSLKIYLLKLIKIFMKVHHLTSQPLKGVKYLLPVSWSQSISGNSDRIIIFNFESFLEFLSSSS